jgi:hypothetical protein
VKPSVVEGILGTVERGLVIRVMGTLSDTDLANVGQTFANALGLTLTDASP